MKDYNTNNNKAILVQYFKKNHYSDDEILEYLDKIFTGNYQDIPNYEEILSLLTPRKKGGGKRKKEIIPTSKIVIGADRNYKIS